MSDRIDIRDPLALPTAAAALSRHADYLRDVRDDIIEKSVLILRRVDEVLIQFRGQLAVAESALRAVPRHDHHAMEAARRRVVVAERALMHATQLKRQLDDTLHGLEQVARVQVNSAERTIERGMNSLARFWEEAGRAITQFGLAVHSANLSPVPASHPPAIAAVTTSKTTQIGSGGHVMVDLSTIDIDLQITGPEDFAKVSLAEMKENLAKLESTVLPIVARGGGLAELSVRDAQASGLGTSYTAVYKAFFGDTSIKLARKSDGRYDVINGRHRIWAARQAGLDTLPVLIKGLE